MHLACVSPESRQTQREKTRPTWTNEPRLGWTKAHKGTQRHTHSAGQAKARHCTLRFVGLSHGRTAAAVVANTSVCAVAVGGVAARRPAKWQGVHTHTLLPTLSLRHSDTHTRSDAFRPSFLTPSSPSIVSDPSSLFTHLFARIHSSTRLFVFLTLDRCSLLWIRRRLSSRLLLWSLGLICALPTLDHSTTGPRSS